MSNTSLVAMTRGVEFMSPTTFRVVDEVYTAPDLPASSDAVAPIVQLLENALYVKLYTRSRAAGTQVSHTLQREFVARLSAANVGRGAYDGGWTVVALEDDGTIGVQKDGLTLWARPQECLFESTAPVIGATARVCVGKEQRLLNPGFYFAFSNGFFDSKADLVRVYWNVSAAGAPPLVRAITQHLNEAEVPFRFKTLNEPQLFARADAAVLYIDRRGYAKARYALVKILGLVRPWLGSETPLMTKRLAPGVGLAEDPGSQETSFGQHRCRVVAEASWQSYRAGRTTEHERLDDLAQAFVARGLDPMRPYLESGSLDQYPQLEKTRSRRAARAR